MNWLVGVALAALGAVLLQVLAEELRDWCPWLAERLIRVAVRQLPDADRGRYQEEWLGELGVLPGKLAKLVTAAGILLRARQVGRVRRGHAALGKGALAFVLVVAAAATVEAVLLLPAAASRVAGDWHRAWLPVAYAAGLVLAERFVVRVPVRNHRVSVGFAEIVIVLGVVFIRTPLLVLATGVGIATSQWLFEPRRVKRLFNVPQYMLSVGAAALVSEQLIGALSRSDPSLAAPLGVDGRFDPALTVLWVLGMAAFFLVNHTLVSVIVSLSGGQGLSQAWLRAAPVTFADWAASTAYGLVIAALVVDGRALLLPLLVVPIGVTVLGNRAEEAHGRRAQGSRDDRGGEA